MPRSLRPSAICCGVETPAARRSLNDRKEILVALGAGSMAHDGAGGVSLPCHESHTVQASPLPTQPHAAGLCSAKGGFGAGGDHGGLVLSHGGQDVDRESIGLWEVDGDELSTRLHKRGDEVDVTGQAVQFRNDEGGAVEPAESERFGDSGAVVTLGLVGEPTLHRSLAFYLVYVTYAHRIRLNDPANAESAAALLDLLGFANARHSHPFPEMMNAAWTAIQATVSHRAQLRPRSMNIPHTNAIIFVSSINAS
jgi:hypothetical protein